MACYVWNEYGKLGCKFTRRFGRDLCLKLIDKYLAIEAIELGPALEENKERPFS